MFGFSVYEISIIVTLIFTSIAQFILVINGRSSDATRLEAHKEKYLNKLYSKANKQRSKLDKTVNKISYISGEKQSTNKNKEN